MSAAVTARTSRWRFLPLILAALVALFTVGLVGGYAKSAKADVGAPSWWSGDCDVDNHPGSHALRAQFNGVKACGPGPNQGGYDRMVNFFPGAWGEYEWECVELSMRYMYLVYGIAPYNSPGGKDVVGNYSGNVLTKVNNDSTSVPSPGDVLSMGATQYNSYGHTAVVTAVSVDGNGNGTITTMEQNASSNGVGSISVSGKHLGSSVTGWLHKPAPPPPPASVSRPATVVSPTSGNVSVYAVGTDHQLYMWYQTSPTSGFTGPVGLGGNLS